MKECALSRWKIQVLCFEITEYGIAVRKHAKWHAVASIMFQFLQAFGRSGACTHLLKKGQHYHCHISHVALVMQFG